MYIFDEMLPVIPWTTPDHQVVAQKMLLGNPQIFTMEQLKEGCEIINRIPTGNIRRVTVLELIDLGIRVPCI